MDDPRISHSLQPTEDCDGRCSYFVHDHCRVCNGVLNLQGPDGDLPDGAMYFGGDADLPIHNFCDDVIPFDGELVRLAPITTPIASVDAAMERALPPLEYTSWDAWCTVGDRMRDNIAECESISELRDAGRLLVEIRARIEERAREIDAREVALTNLPLKVA